MSTTITTVGTSLTVIAQEGGGVDVMTYQIRNGSGAALNALVLEARCGNTNFWESVPISTDVGSPWPASSTVDLTTLTTNAGGLLFVAARQCKEWRVRASVAAGSTEVTVFIHGG